MRITVQLIFALGLLLNGTFSYAETPNSTDSVIAAKVTQSLMIDVVKAGKRLIAVGERGHIIYSDNAGADWTQAKVPTRTLITAVYFSDSQHGWAVGHDAIVLHTNDGGMTWVEQYSDPFKEAVVKEDTSAMVGENDALDDEGEYVDEVSRSGSPLLDVWFRDENYGFAIGAYGYFLHTTDGGKQWRDWTSHIDNPDGWHFNAIAAMPGGVLIVAGEKGIMYRSKNVGQDWEALSSPYDGSFFGVLNTKSPNVVLVYGLQGNIFRSIDQGETWKSVSSGVETGLNAGTVLDDGTIYLVGNSGVILTSFDGGKSFSKSIREDRKSLVGVSASPDGSSVIFSGQSGIKSSSLVSK